MARLLELHLPCDGVAIEIDNVSHGLDILRSPPCFEHYPAESYPLMFQENLENNDSDQEIFNHLKSFLNAARACAA